ncbi:MAG TPA: histidine kinase [Streptosporangiaceae bacterium]|nr:histidine kinase [Streptosporangiaceae bacterium]
MTTSASPRRPGPPVTAASRTSWPGALADRALSILLADVRRPRGPLIVAALLAVSALIALPRQWSALGPALPLVALAATAPVALIRRYPAAAISVLLAAGAAFMIFGRLVWPVPAIAGWLLALAACPLVLSRRGAVWALAVSELAVLTAAGVPGASPWDATLAEALAVVAAWGAGETLRARRRAAADHAAAAARLRDLGEREVLARERAAIARELHDVVAHHVSMIAVRAGTAPYAIDGLPGPGAEAFGEIAQQARTALTELRVVLGVLRDPGRASEAAPQPGLADVPGLLARARSAGTNVTSEQAGLARPLPGSVELCGYRIVQEAVTNAGRHAPGSQVRVTLGYQQAALAVTVRNDAPAPARLAARDPVPAAGFGLTGLRERVAMLGGQITAGPDGAGGFAVSAVLPAPPGAAAPAGPEGARLAGSIGPAGGAGPAGDQAGT